MKIDDLVEVEALVARRKKIKSYITAAMAQPDTLQIRIGGDYMDDNMIALVKHVVFRELSARISVIDRQLQQLGVDLG